MPQRTEQKGGGSSETFETAFINLLSQYLERINPSLSQE